MMLLITGRLSHHPRAAVAAHVDKGSDSAIAVPTNQDGGASEFRGHEVMRPRQPGRRPDHLGQAAEQAVHLAQVQVRVRIAAHGDPGFPWCLLRGAGSQVGQAALDERDFSIPLHGGLGSPGSWGPLTG